MRHRDDAPSCGDCAHRIGPFDVMAQCGVCVNEAGRPGFCDFARRTYGLCGPAGRYFEPLPGVPPKPQSTRGLWARIFGHAAHRP